MKTFKAMGAAAILALSLSIPAFADTNPGDGHGPGKPAPTEDTGTPTAGSENTTLGGSASSASDDISFPTFADFLWALASIY